MSTARVRNAQNRAGFSLVELLVVITFIAIIWVVWFVYGSNFKSKEYNGKRVTDIAGLETIIQSYAKTHGNALPNPNTNAVYFDSLGIYVHAGSGTSAYGVSSKASRDIIGKDMANELPTDPDTKQFYGYGKLINNSAFSLATVVKTNDEFRAYVRGSYDGKRLPSLVRSYNGGSFVSHDGTDDLPYNPYEKRLTAKVTHSDSGAIVTIKRNGLTLAGNPLETEIEAHDTVTVENGGATMIITDGTEVSFGTGAGNRTSLALNTLEYADLSQEDSVATRVKVALLEGESWFKAPRLDPESTLEVSTETAVAAVRWTVFGLSKSGSLSRIVLIEWKLSVKQVPTGATGTPTNISGPTVIHENGESLIEVLPGQAIERIDLQSTVSGPNTMAFEQYSAESLTGSTELQNITYADPFEYAKESLIRGFTGTKIDSSNYSGSISITNPYRVYPFERSVQSGSLTYVIRALDDVGNSTHIGGETSLSNPEDQTIALQTIRYPHNVFWLAVDICSKSAISFQNPSGCREVGKISPVTDNTGWSTVIRTAFPKIDTSVESKISIGTNSIEESKSKGNTESPDAKPVEIESMKTQTGEAAENVQTEANLENLAAIAVNSNKVFSTWVVFDESAGYKADYGTNLPQGKTVYRRNLLVTIVPTWLIGTEFESATRHLWLVWSNGKHIVPDSTKVIDIFGKSTAPNPRFRFSDGTNIQNGLIGSGGNVVPNNDQASCEDPSDPYPWSDEDKQSIPSMGEIGSNENVQCYGYGNWGTQYKLWWTNCGSAYFGKAGKDRYYGIYIDGNGSSHDSLVSCRESVWANRKDTLWYNISGAGVTGAGASYKISAVVRGGGLLRSSGTEPFEILTGYSGALTNANSRTIRVGHRPGVWFWLYIWGAAFTGTSYIPLSEITGLGITAFDRAEVSIEINGSGAAVPAILRLKNLENGKETSISTTFKPNITQMPLLKYLSIGWPADPAWNSRFDDVILESKIIPGKTETVCVSNCKD